MPRCWNWEAKLGQFNTFIKHKCRGVGIGRQARLRGVWDYSRAGSSPVLGTRYQTILGLAIYRMVYGTRYTRLSQSLISLVLQSPSQSLAPGTRRYMVAIYRIVYGTNLHKPNLNTINHFCV